MTSFCFMFCVLFSVQVLTNAKYKDRDFYKNITRDSSLPDQISCGISYVHSKSNDRIVRGTEATPHEFPWIVSIQKKFSQDDLEFSHFCGGVIIDSNWIATAAHCFPPKPIINKDSLRMVAGAHNIDLPEGTQQIRSIDNINTEPSIYLGGGDYVNDIALIKVSEPFDLDGTNVAPICLPDYPHEEYAGSIIYAGWGMTEKSSFASDVLFKVAQQTITREQCENLYGSPIKDCEVCTNSDQENGACKGDSGGPGMYLKDGKYYLWGLVSYGDPIRGCGNKGSPDINADVTCFMDWINKNLNDATTNMKNN